VTIRHELGPSREEAMRGLPTHQCSVHEEMERSLSARDRPLT
jgi:hypothetical protein